MMKKKKVPFASHDLTVMKLLLQFSYLLFEFINAFKTEEKECIKSLILELVSCG